MSFVLLFFFNFVFLVSVKMNIDLVELLNSLAATVLFFKFENERFH